MIVVLNTINITISNEYFHFVFVVLLLSGLVIILKAPIESENKPLNDDEYKKYRKKSLVIMAVEIIVAICSFYFNKTISVCTACAVIIAACMLLVSLGTDIIKRKMGLISSQ
jgi:accessory gene regulator protein AgrB